MTGFKDVKRGIRISLGGIVSRLHSYAEEYQAEQRKLLLHTLCLAHPTANITSSCKISNVRGMRKSIRIGANSAVLGEILVFPNGGQVQIGDQCYVGEGSRIWSRANITIGNCVLIAHNVNIHDNSSHSLRWDERRGEISQILPALVGTRPNHDLNARPIIIEDDAWIGFNSVVLGGVTIGKGAIVGAATVVTRDVPAHSLVVGNPMRVVKTFPQSTDPNVKPVRSDK